MKAEKDKHTNEVSSDTEQNTAVKKENLHNEEIWVEPMQMSTWGYLQNSNIEISNPEETNKSNSNRLGAKQRKNRKKLIKAIYSPFKHMNLYIYLMYPEHSSRRESR